MIDTIELEVTRNRKKKKKYKPSLLSIPRDILFLIFDYLAGQWNGLEEIQRIKGSNRFFYQLGNEYLNKDLSHPRLPGAQNIFTRQVMNLANIAEIEDEINRQKVQSEYDQLKNKARNDYQLKGCSILYRTKFSSN